MPAEHEDPMIRSPAPRQGLEPIDRVRALAPSIRAESEQIEKAGRLTDEIVHALKDADVFGMAIPLAMGGPAAAQHSTRNRCSTVSGGTSRRSLNMRSRTSASTAKAAARSWASIHDRR